MFSVNSVTGAASIVGSLSTDDLSALAFSPNGTLFALDAHGNSGRVSTVDVLDPSTGAVLSATPLSLTIGDDAGLAFDPATGVAYVASRAGGTAGINLCILNTTTGAMSPVGLTANGISGLAFVPIPEPSSLVLAAFGLIGLTAWRWRRLTLLSSRTVAIRTLKLVGNASPRPIVIDRGGILIFTPWQEWRKLF